MTAFGKISKGIPSDADNIKDGHRLRFNPFGFWGVSGFMPADPGGPGEWTYTNTGIIECPVFEVIETYNQIIATLGGEVTEAFGLNGHKQVKLWLDDQILIIKRFEADVEASLDWKPAADWIDVDAFMAAG